MSKLISDKELIGAIRGEGSTRRSELFEMLYKRHFKAILKYVIKNSGSEEDAADIFQDALIIFYLKVKKGQFTHQSGIGTYLYAVARNLWLKKLRKKRFDLSKVPQELTYVFDEESIIQGSQLTMREALEHIGETCKCLLIDFYYHRKSVDQLMKQYGLGSKEATRNKKYRCVQRLIAFVKKNNIDRSDFVDG